MDPIKPQLHLLPPAPLPPAPLPPGTPRPKVEILSPETFPTPARPEPVPRPVDAPAPVVPSWLKPPQPAVDPYKRPWESGVTPAPDNPKLEEANATGAQKDPVTGKFMKGQGGRRKGSRNRITVATELMMESEGEAITRKCIELAKAGDPTALRIVMDRIYPVRKGRILPKLEKKEGEGTVNALLRAVLDGQITPDEGTSVVNLIESTARVAALQALGEQRQQHLEAFKRAQERGLLSGMMIVPMAESPDEWEEIAMGKQAKLKAEVKE